MTLQWSHVAYIRRIWVLSSVLHLIIGWHVVQVSLHPLTFLCFLYLSGYWGTHKFCREDYIPSSDSFSRSLLTRSYKNDKARRQIQLVLLIINQPISNLFFLLNLRTSCLAKGQHRKLRRSNIFPLYNFWWCYFPNLFLNPIYYYNRYIFTTVLLIVLVGIIVPVNARNSVIAELEVDLHSRFIVDGMSFARLLKQLWQTREVMAEAAL